MSESKASGGIGFVGLLTIALIVLRLCDVIKWSWWLVLSPLWITALIAVVVIIVVLIIALLVRIKNE